MSVNERIDIDYKGTEQIADSQRGIQIADSQRGIGKTLAHARSGQDNGSERTSGNGEFWRRIERKALPL